MSVNYQASLEDINGNPTSVFSDDTTTLIIQDDSNYAETTDIRNYFSASGFRKIVVTQPDGSIYTLSTDTPYDQVLTRPDRTNPDGDSFSMPLTKGDGRYNLVLYTAPLYAVNNAGGLRSYAVGDCVVGPTGIRYICIQIDPAHTVNLLLNTAYWTPLTSDDSLSSRYKAVTTVFCVSNLNKRYYNEFYEAATFFGTGIDYVEDPDRNNKLLTAYKLYTMRVSIENCVNKKNFDEATNILNYSENIEDID